MTKPQDAQERLLSALETGNLDGVKSAVADGADIEHVYSKVQLSDGRSPRNIRPLYMAVLTRNEPIAQWLLQHKADPLALNNGVITALCKAASLNLPNLIVAMAKTGINLDTPLPDGFTALDKALDERAEEAFVQLLAWGASPHPHASRSSILYHLNVLAGSNDIPNTNYNYKNYATALLDAGADMLAGRSAGVSLMDDAHETLRAVYHAHLLQLDRKLACALGSGLPDFPLIHEGKPTKELNHICGAGELGELFCKKRWHGKEREALKLYDQIAHVLPDYYRPALQAVDMTEFRRNMPNSDDGSPAVKRYVRSASTSTETQR